MSNIRKDSYVSVASTVGQVVSMSKKTNKIVIAIGGSNQTFDYDTEMSKINKAEFSEISNSVEANIEPPKKINTAQLSRDLFVELTKDPKNQRKHVISAFKEILGLTDQGAKTYYYNCTTARKNNKI